MGTTGFSNGYPCIAIVIGRLRAYPEPRDRHVIYIDASLATMSFLFALETQGIASCCINWPEVHELEVEMIKLLRLEVDERPVMLIALGYPDPTARVPYSQKRPLPEWRSFNHISDSLNGSRS